MAHVRVVVDKNAEMLSNGEWYAVDKNGDEIEHPVIDLLNKPNPAQSGREWLFSISVNEDVHGNAFASIVGGQVFKESVPEVLWPLPSEHLKMNLTGKLFKQLTLKDIISGYKLKIDDYEVNFDTDEVIHFKQPGANILKTESKIKSLQPQLSNLKNAYDTRNVLIVERGPVGLISYDGSADLQGISKKEREEKEQELQDEYGVAGKQRRNMLSKLPMKFTPMGFKTKDLMLFEEVADAFNIILDAFGQNINIFSRDKGATFENYKETLKSVYENNIIPRGERYAEKLTHKLITDGSGVKIKIRFDIKALQDNEKERFEAEKAKQEAFAKRVETLDKLLAGNHITPDEYKELLNLQDYGQGEKTKSTKQKGNRVSEKS